MLGESVLRIHQKVHPAVLWESCRTLFTEGGVISHGWLIPVSKGILFSPVAFLIVMIGSNSNYEGQSISNASYFFSPLLFKKTQIQLHSFKPKTLTINLSLFNIISVHFHRFGPPFNKGMYSSPVKSKVLSPKPPKPLTHGRFYLVCPLASLQ